MKKLLSAFLLATGLLLFFGTQSAISENGKGIVQDRCSRCHGLMRVERRSGQDAVWWERTVDRMIGKQSGLLNEQERETVIDYLSNPR